VKQPRVFIIGLDSATWDLINPWIQQGLLPNLAKLVEGGASGKLQSALPPLTPPAWTSFMTGKNPGKHGIFHFLEPQPGSYAMRYSNAGSRRSASVWKLLSDAGFSVGSVNVPFTFPPEKCAAFQISGMDTPSEDSAYIHPPEMREELTKAIGDKIELEVRYLGFMTTDERREQVLESMRKLDEQWTKIGLHLIDKRPAEVMMLTFMSIDTVQHYFWHYMDPKHFQHDAARVPKFGEAIQRVYRRLDDSVGKFVAKLPADCTVVVVSDHGGGPTSDRTVYLNRYLAQLGLLHYKESATGSAGKWKQRMVRKVYDLIRGSLTSGQKKKLASLFPAMREKMEVAASSFNNIDWTRTKAYCSEVLASPPSIWINLKGTRPNGIVDPSEYEALRDLLIEKINALRDPRDGSAVVPQVFKREELFTGPFSGEAPDLVLDWWSDNAFQTGTSFPESTHEPVMHVRERTPMTTPEWSGTHRLQGMLIVKGPATRAGAKIEGARLMDMTPTLLYLMGQQVPEDMDGHVLTDLFTAEHLQKNPVQTKAVAATAESTAAAPYSPEEAAQVEERLKSLGYIE
jgi:predicted AlkP superfamily phosphohydrolase/phosphomutase